MLPVRMPDSVQRFLGSVALIGAMVWSPFVRAQTPDELAAARRMFAEAFQDEEHAQFAIALEKFRRVRDIKDTATVRFRIGACLDALGRLDEAGVEYDAAVARADASQRDISAAASQKAASARLRMPRLTVDLAEPQVETAVRIDDRLLPPSRVGAAQNVNPGKHTIDADAPGRPHFHADVELREAQTSRVRVVLGAASASGSHPGEGPPLTVETPSKSAHSTQETAGWVTLVAGASVATAGVVVLLLRQGQISAIHDRCPGDVCASGDRDTISGKQSTARTLGPLGVTLVGVGAAATVVGASLLLLLPKVPSTSAILFPTSEGIQAAWAGRF